jgi:hypothetical protein
MAPQLAADLFLFGAGYRIKIQKRPRKRACWGNLREIFSELQTVWRWSQSPANSSLPEIPVNREIYREFWQLSGSYRPYLRVNARVNGFQPEIATGNEQGNNRRDNRENMSRNRLLITLPDASQRRTA